MDCEWTAHSPPSIPWLRCPWARHWTPNCSPGAGAMAALCSGCVFTVCVFTTHCCVCALGWVKCRAPISSMGHHTWQYITLLLFYIISTCPSCLCVSQFAVVQIWTASCAAVMLCEDSSAGPGAGPDSVVLVKPIAETSTDPVQEVIHSSTYVSSVIPAHGGFRWVKVRVPQTLMSFNVWCFWKTSFVLIKAAFIW